MNYGYIRVSTDKQTVENQRYEITEFAQKNDIQIDEWIEETISGTLEPGRRQLGTLLEKVQKDDLIICSELSRLGRSLFMIMSILNKLMETGARVWTIKDGYRLGDDIQSKVLAFAFGLSAEIERNLISQRTKEALERKKSEGMILGRPKGKISNSSKLDGSELETSIMLVHGISINRIAKLYGVHRNTVKLFIKKKRLNSEENIQKVMMLCG
ncbi:MAG: master DNA invertase Mpi family serine-type recombinase [Treponema sp.]|nr:master DNA invertase Mpi family serine-type recombinase [Treponema sp.]